MTVLITTPGRCSNCQQQVHIFGQNPDERLLCESLSILEIPRYCPCSNPCLPDARLFI
jgi:hypothetical protein